MWQADTTRRAYLAGVVAKLAVQAARAVGKPLAREELGVAKGHDTDRVFYRYSSNFPHAEGTEAVERRARRCGVPMVLVEPACTSAEGRSALCAGPRLVGA
jgi:hypothetical protein